MKINKRIKIFDRKKIVDKRGWFVKIITGEEEKLPNFTGEIYVISAGINESRANHYHLEANEWFTLIVGKAELKLEDVDTKDKLSINLDSSYPKTIYVPNRIAHSFKNIGEEPYILVTYTDKLYDPSDTIPFNLA